MDSNEQIPANSAASRRRTALPKIGIRPSIDGRLGGVTESAEAHAKSKHRKMRVGVVGSRGPSNFFGGPLRTAILRDLAGPRESANPYENALQQLEICARRLSLDPGLQEVLQRPEPKPTVQYPLYGHQSHSPVGDGLTPVRALRTGVQRSGVRKHTRVTHLTRSIRSEEQKADQVHFTLTAPCPVARNEHFMLDIWAHLDKQRQEVIRRAKEAQGTDICVRSTGGIAIEREARITFKVSLPGFHMEDTNGQVVWKGEIANASFAAQAPSNASYGKHAGKVRIFVEGMEAAHIDFVIQVARRTASVRALKSREHWIRSAFASYAATDRKEVLARIQSILKVAPHMDIFVDVVSLRSGERWEERLQEEIVKREVLYLFWSVAASKSRYVDWEWRIAYAKHGLDGIDPVPLVSPSVAPPPEELASLHFNDWTLAYAQ